MIDGDDPTDASHDGVSGKPGREVAFHEQEALQAIVVQWMMSPMQSEIR